MSTTTRGLPVGVTRPAYGMDPGHLLLLGAIYRQALADLRARDPALRSEAREFLDETAPGHAGALPGYTRRDHMLLAALGEMGIARQKELRERLAWPQETLRLALERLLRDGFVVRVPGVASRFDQFRLAAGKYNTLQR